MRSKLICCVEDTEFVTMNTTPDTTGTTDVAEQDRSSSTEVGKKCCALADCNSVENLRLCSRCKVTYYCGKDHQILHWKVHKKECHRSGAEGSGKAGPSPVIGTAACSTVITTSTTTASTSSTSRDPTPTVADSTQENAKSDQKNPRNGMQRKLDNLNLASSTPVSSEGETESSPVVVTEMKTFSHSIIQSNSYPLTPLCDEQDETDESDKDSSTQSRDGAGSHVRWIAGASEESLPQGPSRYKPGKIGLANQSREWIEKLTNYLVECMHKCGLCVIDRVLGSKSGDMILEDVLKLHQQDRFSDGQLVKNTSAEKGTIRGDKIMWTDGVNPPCPNIQWLISQMDTIVMKTNGRFKNVHIESRTKAMVACYPSGGSRYVKHVDNPNQDGRVITCIYYLNKNWNSKKEGGLLKIYPQGLDHIANIEPVFDRLIFFWSDMRNPHEVLPAYRTRYAITVWYFDTRERKMAKEKLISKIQGRLTSAGQQITNKDRP